MNRPMLFAVCALTCAMVCVPTRADDPPKKLTPAERFLLEAKRKELDAASDEAYQGGNYPGAQKSSQAALDLARQLYPKADFPNGHTNLAQSVNSLGLVFEALGRYAEAEVLYQDAFEMRKRLFKGDHLDLARSLNNLGVVSYRQGKFIDAEQHYKNSLEMKQRLFSGDHVSTALSLNNLAALYESQSKYAEAEPLFKVALEMNKRLFKGDHPSVALSLHNLGFLCQSHGKHAEAEVHLKDALEMYRKLFDGDNPAVAQTLDNLGQVFKAQGKYAEAEGLYRDALEMRKRLFKGGHLDLARSLNNLGQYYWSQGKYAEAEQFFKGAQEAYKRLFKDDNLDMSTVLGNQGSVSQSLGKYAEAEPFLKGALEMSKRFFKGNHLSVAHHLTELAGLYWSQGKYADAEPLYKEALAIYRRLVTTFAGDKTEGETLTFVANQPLTRDAFLSNERAQVANPVAVYPEVWAEKGYITRAYERRQLQARATAADHAMAKTLAELTDARRRRAELLLAPATKDPATLAKRNQDIKTYDERIDAHTRELKTQLPALGRIDRLDAATPTDLQKVLPVESAVVDFLRYTHFEQDKDKPGKAGEKRTPRYLAFVVTKDNVSWADLGTAADLELAVEAWRKAIDSRKDIPPAVPAKVRELVWDKVRKELPVNIKTVYVCPDAALCKLPFAALPGDKPGTILLEDFAVAIIPHAPFLLDKLWKQDERKNPPTGALVVGGVKYDAELAAPAGTKIADPLVKPGAKLGWGFLANTVGEANGVATAAERKRVGLTRFDGDKATTVAVLAALPKAKYAHFATHGFFADPSFRGPFQLDEKDYEMRGGERVGRAVNSPLLMTGLVFAGANNPKTPGRGVLTGEALIDLDLSGLDLAVLSACETGLGDVAGGQGVFGLQRAFHYAGTTNVVCSLWKVPDESTAALMALFYQNLWDKNLTPMESLRQAQLEVYRNPQKIPALAKELRGKFDLLPGMGGEVEVKPNKDGKAHPLLWAAFTLSGPGR